MDEAELEGVAADLHDVVEEGAEGGERVGRREERHVAELDEHLQVVLEGALVLRSQIWLLLVFDRIGEIWAIKEIMFFLVTFGRNFELRYGRISAENIHFWPSVPYQSFDLDTLGPGYMVHGRTS